ncbi:MAG: HdeD family acid-resistance protein [Bergeyella sp.]|nr:HdeD family acid-resistance protein [Bergeyella sp.]
MSENFVRNVVGTVKHWYVPLVIGIVLVLVGFWVFRTPVESYVALATIFSVLFLLSGVLQLLFALANRGMQGWGWQLAAGLFYTVFGFILVVHREITMLSLPFFVGFYVLFQSINALGVSIDLKSMKDKNWGFLAFFSVVGILLSFILLWDPLFAGLSLVVYTALSFIFSGISSIIFSLRLRKLNSLSKKIHPSSGVKQD